MLPVESKKDSVQKEMLVVSATTTVCVEKKVNSHKMTEEDLRKEMPWRQQSIRKEISEKKCKNYLKGNCTDPSCDYWNPPECQHHKTEAGCKFDDKCVFKHTEIDKQPSKKVEEKWWKGLVSLSKKSLQLGCVSLKNLIRESQFHGKETHWDEIIPSLSWNVHEIRP